jgi:hypothetical protein
MRASRFAVEALERGLDRVDPGRERHVALELRRPPREDEVAAPLRLGGELCEQPATCRCPARR